MLKLSLITFLTLYLSFRLKRSLVTETIDEEYDFVIVGGGTTGLALASRLSEDRNAKILVLEAGVSDAKYPSIKIPAYDPLPLSPADWDYRTVPQEFGAQSLRGKIDRWPVGKILGGTSSMNHLIYNRGSPHDFDSWEDEGAHGWNWEGVEPFFVKAEGADDDGLSERLGKDGPLTLQKGYKLPIINDLFERAAAELGIQKTDYNENMEGFSEIVVTRSGGVRLNSAEAYLRKNYIPERKERLHIMVGAHATKILFNSKNSSKARGVMFVKDGETRSVFARKEVIISAGAIGSPHLLLLSGIGPRQHLEDLGIPVVVDLPGVGSNVQDHLRMLFHIYSDVLPKNASITREGFRNSLSEYLINGTGPFLTNLLSGFIHYRTRLSGTSKSASSKKHPFPDIMLALFPYVSDLQDLRGSAETETAVLSDFLEVSTEAATRRNGIISNFGIVAGLQHPKSRGTIRLNTTDPFQHPLIDPKLLSNQDDIDVYVEGLKLVDRLINTKALREIGARHVFQPFCKELDGDIRTDEFYRCWVRATAVSQYHPCCSAKIGGKSDKTAVVDERLRVYGTSGLRIADASVMPHEPSGNTQAVCYMIAEKAAHMIKKDWNME